eukprot:3905582-Rhodomonas_salina.2
MIFLLFSGPIRWNGDFGPLAVLRSQKEFQPLPKKVNTLWAMISSDGHGTASVRGTLSTFAVFDFWLLKGVEQGHSGGPAPGQAGGSSYQGGPEGCLCRGRQQAGEQEG